MRLNDGDYVSKQYLTTSNLNVRTSVWQANLPGRSPQDLAIKALREVEPRRILEIGSGTGNFALRMTEELGCEVIATDSSAAMTATSRAQGARSILADARFLPFMSAGFDAVVAAWMLYHVSPLDQALREVGRVLRPGGRLVAITNGRKHLAELWSAVETEPSEPAFSVENGSSLLRTHFANVQQHDVSTRAIFENKATAAAYLSSIDRADLAEDLPDSGWPLSANGASAVFVADTAR